MLQLAGGVGDLTEGPPPIVPHKLRHHRASFVWCRRPHRPHTTWSADLTHRFAVFERRNRLRRSSVLTRPGRIARADAGRAGQLMVSGRRRAQASGRRLEPRACLRPCPHRSHNQYWVLHRCPSACASHQIVRADRLQRPRFESLAQSTSRETNRGPRHPFNVQTGPNGSCMAKSTEGSRIELAIMAKGGGMAFCATRATPGGGSA